MWRFGFILESPGLATVRALDPAGGILTEQKVPLVWQQVGATTGCGAPATAAPVTLAINS